MQLLNAWKETSTTKATQETVSVLKSHFELLTFGFISVDEVELIVETMEEGIEDGNKRSLRVRTKPNSSKETLDER